MEVQSHCLNLGAVVFIFARGLCTRMSIRRGGGGFKVEDQIDMGGLEEWMSTSQDRPKYNCDKRNARSLPGVIYHYAKAKILHGVYCVFSEG